MPNHKSAETTQVSLSAFAYLYSELGKQKGYVEQKENGTTRIFICVLKSSIDRIEFKCTTLLFFLVQYHQNRVDSISELERRLESSGYEVGLKILELITYRNREV